VLRQKNFSKKYNLQFPLLSDSDASISKLYGVDTYFFPKRVTFLINKDGVVFDIIKNISLDNYANKIIQIFEKNNLINDKD
jgi:peroxiredoxin Q/BCP